ncbi:hypothetical protein [Rufibacter hautae]|uniref:Uncharacterized protein n=1 Tax=Rufibacter hautae TaxID=2595005 RepID=A0A5B6TB08_9BACT|nr:hypothetical protein [Rufibacter hautae]KAA3437649.1 hypothetical protein FOA19_10090 [Rufibacter hautae]
MRKSLKYLILLIVSICYGCAYESKNREKLTSSFEDNFGFKPPEKVKEIKLKNLAIYDTEAKWMAFTYDSQVFEKIIAHDQPLKIAENNSSEFESIVEELKGSVNNPKWMKIPNEKVARIYYKNDFLDHTFSEYYLWTDCETGLTYLYVSFFN